MGSSEAQQRQITEELAAIAEKLRDVGDDRKRGKRKTERERECVCVYLHMYAYVCSCMSVYKL